jgi:opacity protein-like surface antigen
MHKKLIAIALAAATLASSAAVAQPMQRGNGPGPALNSRGCFPGERSSNCSQRRQAEQRGGHHYVWRNGRYEDSTGAAIAGGILGFMLGAAIVGSNSDRDYYNHHRNDRGWRTRCQTAYNGFDYRTGTYLGPDGYRHYCTR